MAERKGVTKELSTFLSWNKENIIGYNVEVINSKSLVNKIWCKLCAKYKQQILKGAMIASLKAFTEGTNVVTKYQVCKYTKFC